MGLIKNSSIVIAGAIISSIIGYISFIYIGRNLTPNEFGIFGALLALFTLISLPALATGAISNKFAAKFSSKKEYGKISFLRKILSKYVLAYIIILISTVLLFSRHILNYLKITNLSYLSLMSLSFVFLMLAQSNKGILQGLKKFRVHSLNRVLESFLKLIFLVILFYLGFGINGAILSLGLSYIFSFFFILFFIREIKGNEKINLKPVLNFFFLVLIINLVLQGLLNLPAFFIKHYFSSEFTGYWIAALNLAKLTLLFTTGISFAMSPEIASRENKIEQKRFFKLAFTLNLIASILIALTFLIIPEFVISLSYGANYLPSANLLKLLGIAMVFFSSLQIYLSYWLASWE